MMGMDERHLTPAERDVLQEALLRSGEVLEDPDVAKLRLAILNIARAWEWMWERKKTCKGSDPRDMFESWVDCALEDAGFPVSPGWYEREVKGKLPFAAS